MVANDFRLIFSKLHFSIEQYVNRALDKEHFFMFPNPYLTFKPYVVSTQENRLSETILLSTDNIGFY